MQTPSDRRVASEQMRKCLLDGHRFDAKLERPNVVRLFFSSTFFDFLQERNYLFNEAFPELDSWCQERGLEFQVVDMRWGVRDNVAMDLGGVNMCIKEIEHCQNLSIGPSFVAFVGDRYGRRPLPTAIPADDLDIILGALSNSKEKNEIKSWYQKDENSVPPVYFLKPVTSKFKNYLNLENPILRDKERKEWHVMQEKLQALLTAAVKKATETNKLQKAHRYVASVTEQEIWKGILDCSEPETHALCFVRNLHSFKMDPNYVQKTKKYADYVDPPEKGELDEVPTEMLKELKTILLPSKLDDTNLFPFTIQFDPTCGINPNLEAHIKYLQKLSRTFIKNLKEMITEGLRQANSASDHDALYKEVAAHANFAVHKAKLYCGQDAALKKLYKKLTDLQLNQPMILYGESGVGKTATVAKLILETWKNVPGPPNVIYRFLGTTPHSSDLESLLLSLANQVAELYSIEPPMAYKEEFSQLQPYFFDMLERVTDPPLIIILDSLDQLSPAHGAHLMNWLPDKIPTKVKILVSVMPNYEDILDRLQARLKPNNQIELTQMSNKGASATLIKLLAETGRTLQTEQLNVVDEVFSKSQNPLLLHLTLVEVSKWRSYSSRNELKLGSDPYEAIAVLFDRLEATHGKVLVSHALSYIVASKNGITEREMEEVLSLDNDVLDDVYQYWAPPSESEIRIPPMVWARLKQELGEFVVSRQRNEMTVMGMYHKQFTEVVNERYLSSASRKNKLHTNLVEFFEGKWFNAPKPIRLKLFGSQNKILWRKVSSQPLRFVRGRYNLRKLDELPHHLLLSGNTEKLKETILMNFDWINAKFEACGMAEVLSDYESYLKVESDVAVEAVRQCLRLAKPTLELPDNEDVLSTELMGRLHSLASRHKCIASLLKSAKQWCNHSSEVDRILLIPDNQAFPSPNGALVTTLSCSDTNGILAAHCAPDLSTTVTVQNVCRLRIWDTRSDNTIHMAELEGLADHVYVIEKLAKVLVWGSYCGLCIYDLKAGNLLHRFEMDDFGSAPRASMDSRNGKNGKNDKRQMSLADDGTNKTSLLYIDEKRVILTKNCHLFLVQLSPTPKILKRFDAATTFDFIRYEKDRLITGIGKQLLKCEVDSSGFEYETLQMPGGLKLVDANYVKWQNKKLQLTAIGFENGRTYCFPMENDSSSRRKSKSKTSSPELNKSITLFDGPTTQSDIAYDTIAIASHNSLAVLCPINFGEVVKVKAMREEISSLKLSNVKPDTLLIVSSSDATLRVFNCTHLDLLAFFSGLWGPQTHLIVSGKYLLSASMDAPFVKVWNLERFSTNAMLTDSTVDNMHTHPAFHIKGGRSTVCSVGADGHTINVGDGAEVKSSILASHTVHILFTLIQADKLIYGNSLGHLRMYVVGKQDELLEKMTGPVSKFSFHDDSRMLVLLLENQNLHSFNCESLQLKELQLPSSVDGKIQDILITSFGLVLFCQERAYLISMAGKMKYKFEFQGTVICHCTRGNCLVLCSKEKAGVHEISVLNIERQRLVYTLLINDITEVTCVEMNPSQRFLFLGCGKGSNPQDSQRQIRIYDADTKEELRRKVYLYLPLVSMRFFEQNVLGVTFEAGHFGRFTLAEPKNGTAKKRRDEEKRRRSTVFSPKSSACVLL